MRCGNFLIREITGLIPQPFFKKMPPEKGAKQTMAMFRWLYLVLAINIRAGVHIAVTPRFPHQNYVVVRCALRICFFI